MQMKFSRDGGLRKIHTKFLRGYDMLDIVEYNGQPALSINGAIIGTEEDIMMHLRKSAKCDILEEELLLNNGGGTQ